MRVGRSEINMHITHTEPTSADEPVTWQIDLSWRVTDGEPLRRYTDKINTAEFVLVHTMLVAAALSCVANPLGRLIVIDEFGQNLDMVNMPAVVEALSSPARTSRLR
jgi:ABC-type cobalamin transport system ATPase subunit